MSAKRQQVVFIERVLWGGGAERVVYDLAHGLDPARYEPVIVSMFRQRDLPVDFRDNIRLCCLDLPQDVGLPYGVPTAPARTSYHVRLSRWLRRTLRPRTRWRQLRAKAGEWKRRWSASPSDPSVPSTAPQDTIAAWYAAAMQIEMPRVQALRDVIAPLDGDCLLIPVMEEATIMTWLMQPWLPRKYLCSLHINESDQFPRMYSDASHREVMRWLFRGACLGAECSAIPSAGAQLDLIENFGLPADRVLRMVNPVDGAAIRAKAEEPPAAPERWQGKHLFVHVARLCCQKNHDLLVEACRLLRKRCDDFVVLCLGDGHRRDELTKHIAAAGLQGHILLPGHADNPFPYMKAARGLLLTSHYEGFALVLVEAILCGCVPISVDCPSGPREVLDDGRCGLLVPQNDPQALADAMYNTVHDDALCHRLLEAGRAKAAEYDAAQVVRQWTELIDRACQ